MFPRFNKTRNALVRSNCRTIVTASPKLQPIELKFNNKALVNKSYLGWALAATALFTYLWNEKEAEAATIPVQGIPGTANERTFIAVKPDGVQRNLVGDIIKRFEQRGYKLVALKMVTPSPSFAAEHYDDLKAKVRTLHSSKEKQDNSITALSLLVSNLLTYLAILQRTCFFLFFRTSCCYGLGRS
jgi:hypothetical protein